jgi:predicted RecA/RadA family phage recombinase
LNETPANLGDDVFYKVKTKRCVLSIPKASYNDYLNASQWGAFVQMSKSIDVVASTGGTVAFTSVDTAQADPVNNAPMRVQRVASSPAFAVNPSAALVSDGARICVLDNQAINFYITPDEGTYIERVRYNNVDVTDQVVNGVFSSLSVSATMGSIEILFHNGVIGLEQTNDDASQAARVYVRDGIIHVANAEAMQQVAVYDLKGVLLFRSNTPDRQYQCTNLSSGFYIVRILLHSGKVENVKVRL